jgi:uncharacterized DUF497 family protein
MNFEWDENKEKENIARHGVSFSSAIKVFEDERLIVREDIKHSADEARYFAIGEVSRKILTVRFTVRDNSIRIFGAGYWRKEKAYYENKYNLR